MMGRKNKPGAGRPRKDTQVIAAWKRGAGKLTAKQVAESVGVSIKTAQKWKPDGIAEYVPPKIRRTRPLSPKARMAVEMLRGGDAVCRSEVAKKTGMTRQRVSQLAAKYAPDAPKMPAPSDARAADMQAIGGVRTGKEWAELLGCSENVANKALRKSGLKRGKARRAPATAPKPGTQRARILAEWNKGEAQNACQLAATLGIDTCPVLQTLHKYATDYCPHKGRSDNRKKGT